MAKLFADPFYTALDAGGYPISGAWLNFYTTGTSTRADTFSDNALTIPHSNPVQADAAGRFAPIYLQNLDYKAVLTDTVGATIETVDPVHGASAENAAKLNEAQTFTKTQTWTHGIDVASAAALTLGDGNIFDITGTAGITSIGTKGVGTIIVLIATGAWTLTAHATDIVLPGGQDIVAKVGDTFILEEYAAADWRLIGFLDSGGVLPTGYSDPGLISVGTDTVNDTDINPTTARDDTDSFDLITTAVTTIALDAAEAGGLDTGAKAADTWYHIWQIGDSTATNPTTFMYSASPTSPTLPSGYDKKHLHEGRAVLTDSTAAPDSEIIPYSNIMKRIFRWKDRVTDYTSASPGITAVLETMTVPTGFPIIWDGAFALTRSGDAHGLISSPDTNDQTPSATLYDGAVSAGATQSEVNMSRLTNSSGQVRRRTEAPTVTLFRLDTLGWTTE